jgi:hypothetical protein
MFLNHPDEILKSNEDIWMSVISMLFRLIQNPTLYRKRYCRRYLVVQMVTLVRQMLRHIQFKDVVEGINK